MYVTLHYRDKFSLGEHRQRLGFAAYHWGLLIKDPTGNSCNAYDATDAIDLDPVTGEDRNPERNWLFRVKDNVDMLQISRLLGMVMIGKVPNEVTDGEIQAHLDSVPLPIKNAVPEQNCVSWTRDAIQKLQAQGIAEQFDIDQFVTDALAFADECLKNPSQTPATDPRTIKYTRRPM